MRKTCGAKDCSPGGDAIYYAGRFLDFHPGYMKAEYGFTHLVTDYQDAIYQVEMLKNMI